MSVVPKFRRRPRSRPEGGYILLTLMFLATLVILSLAALAPEMAQQVKRDREEELIHRGVQYSRAIQHFYKKTGRYPVRLEELDNLNNVRFLRKHYKDPITGEDFKLLHFGEVQMMIGAGGAGVPGAVAAANAGNPMGGNPMNGQVVINPQTMSSQSGFNQNGPFAQNQNGSFGQNVQQMAGTANQSGDNATDSTSISPNSGPEPDPNDGSNNEQNPNGQNGGPLASTAFGTPGQQFGGGPIVGVVSTSKKKSIREFNKKDHYKDWQFIYDPSSDRGGLLNTPAQPNLNAGMGNANQNNGQAGPGQGQGFGGQNQQPFGQAPNSFGQQPGGFGQQGMPMPNQPPDQMQQQ